VKIIADGEGTGRRLFEWFRYEHGGALPEMPEMREDCHGQGI